MLRAGARTPYAHACHMSLSLVTTHGADHILCYQSPLPLRYPTQELCRCEPAAVDPATQPIVCLWFKCQAQAQSRRLIATLSEVGRASVWSLPAPVGNRWPAPPGRSEVPHCPSYFPRPRSSCLGGDGTPFLYSIMDACGIHGLWTALGRPDASAGESVVALHPL